MRNEEEMAHTEFKLKDSHHNNISYSVRQVEEIDVEAGMKEEGDIVKREVANLYRKFMTKNKVCEESGIPIGSDKGYLKELDANKKVKEKLNTEIQKRRDRFYGLEKQMPKKTISNHLENGLPIPMPVH